MAFNITGPEFGAPYLFVLFFMLRQRKNNAELRIESESPRKVNLEGADGDMCNVNCQNGRCITVETFEGNQR